MTTPHDRVLLRSSGYQQKLARGLVAGVRAFVAP
jgi:N-acetylmuramoyl-L-alanine amidase